MERDSERFPAYVTCRCSCKLGLELELGGAALSEDEGDGEGGQAVDGGKEGLRPGEKREEEGWGFGMARRSEGGLPRMYDSLASPPIMGAVNPVAVPLVAPLARLSPFGFPDASPPSACSRSSSSSTSANCLYTSLISRICTSGAHSPKEKDVTVMSPRKDGRGAAAKAVVRKEMAEAVRSASRDDQSRSIDLRSRRG